MSALFWNLLATKYAKSPVADEAAYQRKLEVTRGYFKPDMEVLEIGCGTGSTAVTHAPHVKHIRAVDISSKMLEIARGKADAKHIENITFERSSIDGLSVPEQSLDAVLGLSILHLLRDKETAIAKVHQMLKPGGVFVSSTVCAADALKPWSLDAIFLRFLVPVGSLLGLLPPVQCFSSQELESSLCEAGFVIDHRWRPDTGRSVFIVAKKVIAEGSAKKSVVCHASP